MSASLGSEVAGVDNDQRQAGPARPGRVRRDAGARGRQVQRRHPGRALRHDFRVQGLVACDE
ncbi:hypothetical protein LP419_18190 [Massilia sp. H-1]|nr:hypothetical protein LP419_18190 [Massilia sp. H-1]